MSNPPSRDSFAFQCALQQVQPENMMLKQELQKQVGELRPDETLKDWLLSILPELNDAQASSYATALQRDGYVSLRLICNSESNEFVHDVDIPKAFARAIHKEATERFRPPAAIATPTGAFGHGMAVTLQQAARGGELVISPVPFSGVGAPSPQNASSTGGMQPPPPQSAAARANSTGSTSALPLATAPGAALSPTDAPAAAEVAAQAAAPAGVDQAQWITSELQQGVPEQPQQLATRGRPPKPKPPKLQPLRILNSTLIDRRPSSIADAGCGGFAAEDLNGDGMFLSDGWLESKKKATQWRDCDPGSATRRGYSLPTVDTMRCSWSIPIRPWRSPARSPMSLV